MNIRRLWPLGFYRVAGDSMLPTYATGATLLGWRWGRPRAGQVVVARRAGRPLIKRLVRVTPAGLWLQGDNAGSSTDSRHFGAVSPTAVEAIIIRRLD
jgi:phage repressor protein C with HTH and peptisase S24 domain